MKCNIPTKESTNLRTVNWSERIEQKNHPTPVQLSTVVNIGTKNHPTQEPLIEVKQSNGRITKLQNCQLEWNNRTPKKSPNSRTVNWNEHSNERNIRTKETFSSWTVTEGSQLTRSPLYCFMWCSRRSVLASQNAWMSTPEGFFCFGNEEKTFSRQKKPDRL